MEPWPNSHGYGGNSGFSAQMVPFARAIPVFDVRFATQLTIVLLEFHLICLIFVRELPL